MGDPKIIQDRFITGKANGLGSSYFRTPQLVIAGIFQVDSQVFFPEKTWPVVCKQECVSMCFWVGCLGVWLVTIPWWFLQSFYVSLDDFSFFGLKWGIFTGCLQGTGGILVRYNDTTNKMLGVCWKCGIWPSIGIKNVELMGYTLWLCQRAIENGHL